MAASEEKFNRRRLRSSYFTVIISITLVLLMIGFMGLVILHAKKISDHVRENIGFSIIINEDVKEADIVQLQKSLDAEQYVKASSYVDKEEAAEILQKDLGEDFIDFLGYNPLLPTIEVHLNANYANPDSLGWIKKDLLENSKIKEVYYQESLVSVVNEKLNFISIVLLIFSIVLLVIAITLINNSIRLSIYSKRFVIKSMQLVGATQSFIRTPFVLKGISHGIFGALLAISVLVAAGYYVRKEFPELIDLQDIELYGAVFGMVLLVGIFISWISTTLAVRKFLKMKSDKLY